MKLLSTSRLFAPAAVFLFAAPLAAQETPADTAVVLLRAARALDAEGSRALAIDLYRLIVERYAGTAAAGDADSVLALLGTDRGRDTGRTELIVWHTLYGAWLGFAIPAALDAEESEPYGAGLLLGGPAGFFGSKAYANAVGVTTGEARSIIFGSQWGTFQGYAFQQLFDIGDREFVACYEIAPGEEICQTVHERSGTAPFAAAVVGGLAGIGTGALIGRGLHASSGDATLVNHAAWWGTWYGFAAWVLGDTDDPSDFGEEDEGALPYLVVGGNAALVASALATRGVEWSPARVRTVSIAGVAGLLAGAGLDLLLLADNGDENEDALVLIPTLTASAALVAAAVLTTDSRGSEARRPEDASLSLVRLGSDLRLGMPAPQPHVLPRVLPSGRRAWQPALRVDLFEARF